jgi:hypothetical protein
MTSTLHQSTASILTATIAQGRLLWSASKKSECYAIYVATTKRAMNLLSGNQFSIDFMNALKLAEKKEDPAKGCVVLRKAFNSYLIHHQPPQPSMNTRTLTATAASSVRKDNTNNSRLQHLRKKAEESAQKFGDEPNTDALIKHVTLSKRVPSMSAVDFERELASGSSLQQKENGNGIDGNGVNFEDAVVDEGSKEPTGPPPSIPINDLSSLLTHIRTSNDNHSFSSSQQQQQQKQHEQQIFRLSRCIMRSKRQDVELNISTIIPLILSMYVSYPNNIHINYHCSLILFELAFNSHTARLMVIDVGGITSLCNSIVRFPSKNNSSRNDDNDSTTDSTTDSATGLTSFDVHDVALNALGLLASHDNHTKQIIGSVNGGIHVCLHSVESQFKSGSTNIVTLCVALDLLQSLTQEHVRQQIILVIVVVVVVAVLMNRVL